MWEAGGENEGESIAGARPRSREKSWVTRTDREREEDMYRDREARLGDKRWRDG